MASIAQAIGDHLAADTAITAALGGDYIYRDRAPEATTTGKYVVVLEGFTRSKFQREAAKLELVQVDLWQQQISEAGTLAEDPLLIDLIERRLDEAVIAGGPTGQFSTEFVSTIRWVEDDTGLIHYATTVRACRRP